MAEKEWKRSNGKFGIWYVKILFHNIFPNRLKNGQ